MKTATARKKATPKVPMPSPARTDKTSPALTLVPPRLGEYWEGQGGKFVGEAPDESGDHDNYIICYDGLNRVEANQKKQMAWAEKLSSDGHKDFTLPMTDESPLLFAILRKTLFKAGGWYWTKTPYAGYESYAWFQTFPYGSLGSYHKDYELFGCAVRRIKIIR